MATYAQIIHADYESTEPDPWEGSPFAWIKYCASSRKRGAIGEKLVAAWCAAKEFDVAKSPESQADRIIEGHRIEIKLSTSWESGLYRFQQIRDQHYEFLFALGLSPFDAHAWIIPKSHLLQYPKGVTGQHTGASGVDTAWLGVTIGDVHDWMASYGGSLSQARDYLASLGPGPWA